MDEQDNSPEILDRFVDPETEILEEFLDQLYDDGAMDLEELDGFFAALQCCPESVQPAEFLPVILGDAVDNLEIFPGPENAKLFFDLVAYYWNAVADAFDSATFFDPLILENDDGKFYGNNWAIGFLRGMELREKAWRQVLDTEEKFAWLIPILALANEENPDPELRSYTELVTDELREKLLAGVSEMVTHMYHFFAPYRELKASAAADSGNPSATKRKIGRNDPCYCGSGEKYKKCCGSIKVN